MGVIDRVVFAQRVHVGQIHSRIDFGRVKMSLSKSVRVSLQQPQAHIIFKHALYVLKVNPGSPDFYDPAGLRAFSHKLETPSL